MFLMSFGLFSHHILLQAQAVALTVAQAFTVAFELWQVAKEGSHLVFKLTHVYVQHTLFIFYFFVASLSLEKGKCSHSERSNSLGGLQAAGKP